MRAKQLEMLPKSDLTCGGRRSHPKKARPLSSKLPIHLTLRAEKSVLRLPKNYRIVNQTLHECARKYGVKIYDEANVGNHLHLAIKIHHVRKWAGFIRELTGRIARALKTGWACRPHTRVIGGWRKAFQIVKQYIELNRWEAEGHINRKETKTLKDLRAIFEVTFRPLPPLKERSPC